MIVFAVVGSAYHPPPSERAPGEADKSPNVVIQWNNAFLQGVRESKLGPPMVARALAIGHTCMFDAWAAYDDTAVSTQRGDSLRRPAKEQTVANKSQAISFAAYRAGLDLFPGSRSTVFDPLMSKLGLDPSNVTGDTTTPAGVGNVACRAVLGFRHHDGSNQLGDEPGGTAGVPYSDYTGYAPVNDPMVVAEPLDPSTVHDPNQWQPLSYTNTAGQFTTPGFVAPQWGKVIPFALTSDSQFRSPTGPAQLGSAQFVEQAQELLDISGHLTDEQKVVAEYWADGPNSELPPGHWNLFAQFVSARDHLRLDDDVKMFFALTNAIFDAGIVAWDNKRAFDSVRPITAVRYLFRGQKVLAWGGPGRGTTSIDGATWLPYQAATGPTPPFPEYASGHSNFSAAGAEILKRFTHSDHFGHSVVVNAGGSKVEPGVTPVGDVTLSWDTFSAAADQAGISRRYGGIHFAEGDLDARRTGRQAAEQAWAKALTYFNW